MKKILLPTDFSNLSRHAMNYAFAYLQDQQNPSQVLVLNTYFPPPMSLSASELIQKHDETRKQSLEGLERELLYLQGITPDHQVTYETLSHMGKLENVMAYLVKNRNISLVLMGKDGQERKLEAVGTPVFLIPNEAAYRGLKNIAFLEDPNEGVTVFSEKLCHDVIGPSPSQLFILSSNHSDQKAWSKFYEKIPHHFHVIDTDFIYRGLESFLDQHKVDLLVSSPQISLPISLKVPVLLMQGARE